MRIKKIFKKSTIIFVFQSQAGRKYLPSSPIRRFCEEAVGIGYIEQDKAMRITEPHSSLSQPVRPQIFFSMTKVFMEKPLKAVWTARTR